MALWVRLRRKRVNLDYAILAEEHDDEPDVRDLLPGGLRLTLETGRVLVLSPGPDVAAVLRAIDDQIGAAAPKGGVGTVCDPETEDPLPQEAV